MKKKIHTEKKGSSVNVNQGVYITSILLVFLGKEVSAEKPTIHIPLGAKALLTRRALLIHVIAICPTGHLSKLTSGQQNKVRAISDTVLSITDFSLRIISLKKKPANVPIQAPKGWGRHPGVLYKTHFETCLQMSIRMN